jgi:ribonuclease-3
VLADAVEALLGAVFLDAGFDTARSVVLHLFGPQMDDMIAQVEAVGQAPVPLSATTANWKTAVQELLQQLACQPPVYALVTEDGPVHAPRFRVQATATIGQQALASSGAGYSKKTAENDAAEGLYRQVEAIVHPAGSVAASVRGAAEADGVESIQRGPGLA